MHPLISEEFDAKVVKFLCLVRKVYTCSTISFSIHYSKSTVNFHNQPLLSPKFMIHTILTISFIWLTVLHSIFVYGTQSTVHIILCRYNTHTAAVVIIIFAQHKLRLTPVIYAATTCAFIQIQHNIRKYFSLSYFPHMYHHVCVNACVRRSNM